MSVSGFPSWTHEDHYHRLRNHLLGRSDTRCAAEVVGLPGYHRHVYLSGEVCELVRRSSEPSPHRLRPRYRLTTVELLLRRAWSWHNLGFYAGLYRADQLLVDAFRCELVLDAGNLAVCAVAVSLHRENLLLATISEHPLKEYFWIDRVLLRASCRP